MSLDSTLPVVLLGDGAAHLEEEPAHHLEDVGLVDDGDLAPAVLHGVLEGVADDPLAAAAGHDGHRLAHRPGVVPDGHEVLDADVESLEILPDQHDVDVLEAAARDDGAGGPDVGEELELLPQPDVDRAEAGAHRRGERALERERVLADALDVASGSGVPVASTAAMPASSSSQLKRSPVASSTFTVCAVISGPMPSPGIRVTS